MSDPRGASSDVERDVAEAVDAENDHADPVLSHLGRWQLDSHELIRVDGRTELLERYARGQVRGGRREQVATVEGPRHRLERVLRVRELMRLGDTAEAVGGRHEQPV